MTACPDAMGRRPPRRRPPCADPALLLVGAARTLGAPLALYRAAGRRRRGAVRLLDLQRLRIPAPRNDALMALDPARRAAGLTPTIRHSPPSRSSSPGLHRRSVLLPGRAAQRAARPQHPVLEVAAGLGPDHRALQGEHSAHDLPADRASRSSSPLQLVMLALNTVVARQRHGPGLDDCDPRAAAAADRWCCLRPRRAGALVRADLRAGCCWSRPGRGARRSCGPSCRRWRCACSRRSPSTPPTSYRLGGYTDAFTIRMHGKLPAEALPGLDPLAFVSTPGLWVGLAFAAAFLAAAVWLRRYREPV
jgi:hypothetical protein